MKGSKMDNEFKCPVCKRIMICPVLLTCSHSLCFLCASSSQVHTPPPINIGSEIVQSSPSSSSSFPDIDMSEIDKLSVVSEADSGVVCSSRPGSFAGTPSLANLSITSINCYSPFVITCPVCRKTTGLDEHGAHSLPKNKLLEAVIENHRDKSKAYPYCQWCKGEDTPADKVCLKCKAFYCNKCVENCHPADGPFRDHDVVAAEDGKTVINEAYDEKAKKCSEHSQSFYSDFCATCRVLVCKNCLEENQHTDHEIVPISNLCKSHKVRILLFSLSFFSLLFSEFV